MPLPMSAESRDQVFRFRYTLFAVEARIDETRLEVQAGVKRSVAPLARLQHLFVHHDQGRGNAELVVSFVAARGRLRRVRVFADAHEPAFDALVAALLARRPEIDIRHLPRDEAYRRMGSAGREAVVLPALMGVVLGLMAVMFAPMVVHGCDEGEARISVAALAAGERPGTRNLVVSGRAAVERVLVAAPGSDAPGVDAPGVDAPAAGVTAWVPLVEPGWDGVAPVAVVLEVRGRPVEVVTGLGEREVFAGLLRDVLWEGLGDRQRRGFAAQGLALAPEVALIEYGATAGDDGALAAGVLGLLAVMVVGVVVSLRRQQRVRVASGPKPRLNRPRAVGEEGDED